MTITNKVRLVRWAGGVLLVVLGALAFLGLAIRSARNVEAACQDRLSAYAGRAAEIEQIPPGKYEVWAVFENGYMMISSEVPHGGSRRFVSSGVHRELEEVNLVFEKKPSGDITIVSRPEPQPRPSSVRIKSTQRMSD